MTISAVINTRNEAVNIARCLRSIHAYVDEIVIVDMESTDQTRTIAREYTKKIYKHRYLSYVEPARNFALAKAKSDWILLLDADESVPESLGLKLRQLADEEYDYFRIPRKNIIFGKWLKHSGWWPDYQIRFFKKGSVEWNDEIHSIPITRGKGTDLALDESLALIHHHYLNVTQYLERMIRYTSIESEQLLKNGKKIEWIDLISQPAQEFFRRFFAWEGYKDGIHGLTLSLLQSFSLLVVQVRLWEAYKYSDTTPKGDEFLAQLKKKTDEQYKEYLFWLFESRAHWQHGVQRLMSRLRAKISL